MGGRRAREFCSSVPRLRPIRPSCVLALFGSQILMHRLQQGESTDVLASAGFIFVYAAETPDALREVLARYQTMTNAPVLVAQKSNVVKTAHFVTEFFNRVRLPPWVSAGPGASKPPR